MTDVYTTLMEISINHPALAVGSDFVNLHPLVQGTLCSQATVHSLDGTAVPSVAAHEGMGMEVNSHTYLYQNRLNSFDSLGVLVEAIVGDNGGIAISTIQDNVRIKQMRDSAIVRSRFADSTGNNPLGHNNLALPCSLTYFAP